MEQQKNIEAPLYNSIICSKRQNASLICCHSQCTNYPFLCRNDSCQCIQKDHRNCKMTFAKTLFQDIQKKRKVIPAVIQQTVQAIQKVYNQAIDKLSKDRQDINLWKQNFGLTIDQATLVHSVKSQDFSMINGKLIDTILANINQKQQTDFLKVQWVENFWKKGKAYFNNIFSMLNGIGRLQFKKSAFGSFKWDLTNQLKQISFQENKSFQNADFSRYIIVQMEPSLSSYSTTTPVTWAIKAEKINDSVGVGICQKKRLISTDYKIEYQHLGHGVFMIHSTGYTFSNSHPQDNYKKKNFEFKEGDIISVRYHPGKHTITFIKNLNESRLVLKTDFPFPGDSYCPCVLFRRQNDSASITKVNPAIVWDQFSATEEIISL